MVNTIDPIGEVRFEFSVMKLWSLCKQRYSGLERRPEVSSRKLVIQIYSRTEFAEGEGSLVRLVIGHKWSAMIRAQSECGSGLPGCFLVCDRLARNLFVTKVNKKIRNLNRNRGEN